MSRRKTPKKPVAGQATIAVDEDGDLSLKVGPDTDNTTFLVCSRTLSRSSPVFKAMLYGSFRESRPADPGASPWVVELPDDNHLPAEILLNIIHGRFDFTPKVMTIDTLYEILAFADKYDMTSRLNPWMQAWVSSVFPLEMQLPSAPGDAWRIIAVSRELGLVRPLKELVMHAIMHSEVNSNGELLWAGVALDLVGSQEMPLSSPQIFQHAAKIRLELVTSILKRVRTWVLGLQTAILNRTALYCTARVFNTPTVGEGYSVCHAATLGYINAGLGQAELKVVWADPNSTPDPFTLYTSSLENLIQKITKITTLLKTGIHGVGCSPLLDLTMDIPMMCYDRHDFLEDETLDYLDRQRTKYGDLDPFNAPAYPD